jgi:hypothetical protein
MDPLIMYQQVRENFGVQRGSFRGLGADAGMFVNLVILWPNALASLNTISLGSIPSGRLRHAWPPASHERRCSQ